MKRIKCYGRMKTACINTAERKVFYGVNEPPLWDFSFGSDDDDFVPTKELKSTTTPCFQNEAGSVLDHLKSPQLFSPWESPNTDHNKENSAAAKPKKKTAKKEKPKKKGKGKKPRKKTGVAKAEPPVDVKEPIWSVINEHELLVEGGNLVRNKKKCAMPSTASPFKHPSTAPNVENQFLNDEPSAKRVEYDANTLSKAGASGLKQRCINHEEQPMNCEQRSSKRIRPKIGVPISRKASGGYGTGLTRSLRRKSVAKSCKSNIIENSLVHNSVEITPGGETQTEISMNADQGATTNTEKSFVRHASDITNQSSILKNSVNCNFSAMTEILPTHEIPAELSDYNMERDISHAMTRAGNLSCTHLERVNLPQVEATNMASASKNLTSTPTVASRMQCLRKMSMFNLSRICTADKEHGLSKRADSFVSMMSVRLLSGMYDNTTSVSFVPRKARSLEVPRDSTKTGCEQSHISSPSQTRPELKPSKSCSCIEKVASNKSLSCSNINQSHSVIEKLLEVCNQETISPFADAYNWNLVKVQKVGEGTYGEVFMLSLKKKASVIKIIPISQDDTNTWMNAETVYSEVKVCQCLSKLRYNRSNKTPNFNKLNSVHFVKGCYPTKLLTAWDTFSTVKSSYNVRPDCFDKEQSYVILDMAYGGTDMASFVMKNAVEAESILKQVAISLAIAEETHLFEHRDLHLGNILVQRTKKKNVSYVLRGQSVSIPSHGVMVTIIDFTLSRIFESGCVYFNNLADDKSLFDQTGDYQFEIYRATREHLKNQWQEGSLFSNVLWLTFLCTKITEYRYLQPTSIAHFKSFNNIAAFLSNLKSCKSAFECLSTCKILSSVPKSDQSVESILKGKAKFVDRKSFQKSKCSILRN